MTQTINYEIVAISKNGTQVFERDTLEEANSVLLKLQHEEEQCDFLINKVTRTLIVESYYKRGNNQ